MERTLTLIGNRPDYLNADYMVKAYQACGLTVIPDPFGPDVADRVAQAIHRKLPFSVVRIADGEMNFLAHGLYATPHLDNFCIEASFRQQADRFTPNELWVLVLRELMLSAVLQADIVGVVGLRRPKEIEYHVCR